MATAIDYLVAAFAYAVWLVGYGVLTTLSNYLLPLAKDLDTNGMFATPISWWEAALGQWLLVFFVGIFVSLMATAIATRGGIA